MVEVQLIPCKKIGAPKGPKLNDSTLQNLHDSIKVEGLWNPIVLRPDPAKPGHYLIVQGKHRFHVVSKTMKEEYVQARVFEDMDEEEANLATMTENACRQAPNGNKRLILIQEWQEAFRKKYPDLIGKRAGGKARADSRKSQGNGEAATDAEPAGAASNGHSDQCSGDDQAQDAATEAQADGSQEGQAEKKPATFRQRMAAATGQKDSTVGRDLRIANNFTREQLEILDPIGVGKLDLLKIIAATKDNENERAEVVNLVCSGMPTDDAIKEVTGLTEVKDVAGRTKGSDTEDGARAKKAEDEGADLSDDEWFGVYCGEFAKLLRDPARYKADAILFRSMSDARAAFRKKVKKAFGKAKEAVKAAGLTPWFAAVHRILNASHPKDWLLCDKCVGKGHTPDGKPCGKCLETGYSVKTEKYV